MPRTGRSGCVAKAELRRVIGGNHLAARPRQTRTVILDPNP
jgi:hypothetical protein